MRKATISNCDTELVNCISKCLERLNGNNALTGCDTRELRKHKFVFRKLVDDHVLLSGKKLLIVQRDGFLLPLMAAVLLTLAILIAR